jgi:hypothetical protein
MAILLHEYDPSAISPLNLVANEPHNLLNATLLIIVADAGLFYTKSMIVQKVSTGAILTLGVDYDFQGIDADITALTGFECACAVSFKDSTLSGQVTLTYQAVGGQEGEISSFIKELRDAIAALDLSAATWNEVKNKPAHYPPASHTHNVLTDLTGLNAIRNVLQRIFVNLTDSRIPVLSGINLNARIDRLLALLARLRADLNTIAAMVKRELVQTNVITETASSQLTSAIAGSSILFNATVVSSFELPDLATFEGDTRIDILNIGPAAIVLAPYSENYLMVSNVGVLLLNIGVNDTLTLVSKGNTWYKFSGTAHT